MYDITYKFKRDFKTWVLPVGFSFYKKEDYFGMMIYFFCFSFMYERVRLGQMTYFDDGGEYHG